MSEPFLAEIRLVSFNFAPVGWAFCDGQILPISQNQSLFSIISNTYGGDARTTFALPELRGRTPIHQSMNFSIGERAGAENITLTQAQIPTHNHAVYASTAQADNPVIDSNALLSDSTKNLYTNLSTSDQVSLHAATVTFSGDNQAHNNMQPYIALSYCIALQGLFPSRN